MKELIIQGITKEYGCVVYTEIRVSDDYTMDEVVNAVKEGGYSSFRLIDTMKAFVKVA